MDKITDLIKSYDSQNVYGSVLSLSYQCLQAWDEANRIEVPDDYKNTDNVIMCGMGGSGLGARVIESLYFQDLNRPFIRINDYHIPSYVNEKSLVFVSSYSGNTEETVQNLNEAIEKKARIIVIGAGGKLIEIAKNHNLPYYLITPTHNPSDQPRMAIGYSVVGQLVLAAKAGLLNISKNEIENARVSMKSVVDNCRIENEKVNMALEFSQKMKGKVVLFVSSGHLIGSTHVVNNQQNENAKNLSFDFTIPELNHHLMEGLKHPDTNRKDLLFVFFKSELYDPSVKQRFEITEDVVRKNDIETLTFNLKSPDKFSQVFEEIQFGGFINFYLSMQYGIDPAPIPWVDYFKNELKKRKS